MATTRINTRILALGVLWAGLSASAALAAPPEMTAEAMAKVQPKQAGVTVANLSAGDLARAKVLTVPGSDPKTTIGYVLADANKQPVRRFLAVQSDRYNILSFYQNGQEVYRETDAPSGRQYRWLGTNGSKIGIDTDNNGSVDVWEAISPEEVSREVFDAIQQRDAAKFQALVVTQKDLATLGLPAAQIEAILARAAGASAKMQKLIGELKLTEKAKWIHVELWVPETIPSDEFQGRADFVRHRNAGVLVDPGIANQAATFQLGEMVQIGRTWKLIDGPSFGPPTIEPVSPGGIHPLPKDVQDLITKLNALPDPGYGKTGYGKHQAARAAILNDVVIKLQNHPQQEMFIRQLIDAYVTAAQFGEEGARADLTRWQGSILKNAPKTPLAAFSTFRQLGLDYQTKLTAVNLTPKQIDSVQTWWREALAEFLKEYPSVDEAAEAHYRLALAEEPRGRDGEKAAKAQYAAIVRNFPNHQLAAQSAGSIRRMECEGQAMELKGTTLDGKAFDVSTLRGSVVAVYYWGSFQDKLAADAKELDALQKKHGGKLKIVTVCMDTDAKVAAKAAQDAGLPGTHLFAADSSLTAHYGIISNHLIIVGADGKVSNKNGLIADLSDAVEKVK